MKTILRITTLFLFFSFNKISIAQVPVLSSEPSSSNVLFLDFDGHVVEGTSWNYGPAIVCDPSNLSTDQMISIFHRVAEDYRPFTLNVTTDSTKYMAAPANRRMRVVLTTSSSWYGQSGGVAYVNSFSWGDNTPCFVFTELLGYNTKYIAEATSHELGHTLGLRHQSAYDAVCNKTSEYNPGKGTGEIGWAPIMGVSYYKNMTLWNYGANPFGCQAYQDDLSIITSSNNGVSFRTDDHSADAVGATAVSFSGNTFTATGIIERPNDVDAFQFSLSSPSRVQSNALPFSIGAGNVGANIDLEIELLDVSQNVIRIYNTETALSTTIDTLLPQGVYYLRIQGKGNIYAPNYASLGSYTLATTVTPGNTLAVHKLQLRAITENKQHRLDWEIVADEAVVSQTLERATNGTNFQPAANLSASHRNYVHQSSLNLTYYRLAVTFDNGKKHYSNIVALRNNGGNTKPYLIGNTVTSSLRISSPSNFGYTVLDMSGRAVARGNLIQGLNTLTPNFSTNGLYIIQFNNGKEVYTEKFSKQ